MRKLYTLVFLLLTTITYGQKSTLLQNVNIRAKELKHHLNKTGDSLVLEGERTIYKVEIFNKDFERSITVKDSKVTIPLADIPVGRFVVEAVLPDRLIVITLLRNEPLNPAINKPRLKKKVSLFGDPSPIQVTETTPEKQPTKEKLAIVNKKEKAIVNKNIAAADVKAPEGIDIESSFVEMESTVIAINRTPSNESSTNAQTLVQNSGHINVEAYWIVYETNKGNSSGRQMRFGDQALVDKMISHINLDKKTVTGKFNQLTIWEIYDVSKFLRYKMRNSNDFSEASESFNPTPYFKTENNSSKP